MSLYSSPVGRRMKNKRCMFMYFGPQLFKISFLSCMKATKCVKFLMPRYEGIKVGLFRIRPFGMRSS